MAISAGLKLAAIEIAAALVLIGVAAYEARRADRAHDQVVTLQLQAKDWQAADRSWRIAVQARDRVIAARAQAEASAFSASNRACSADSSAAFQKGLAAGQAIAHAKPDSDSAGLPVVGGLRDFSQLWAQGSFDPAAP